MNASEHSYATNPDQPIGCMLTSTAAGMVVSTGSIGGVHSAATGAGPPQKTASGGQARAQVACISGQHRSP